MTVYKMVAVLGFELFAGLSNLGFATTSPGDFLIDRVVLQGEGDNLFEVYGQEEKTPGVTPGAGVTIGVKREDATARETYQALLTAFANRFAVKLSFDQRGHVLKVDLKK